MKVTGTNGKEYTIGSRADLDGAYLRGTNLSGASLRGTNLNSADSSGAIWNDETVFPEGFEIPEGSQA